MTGILRNMCCPSALDSWACMCHSVCSNNLDEKHTLLKEMGTRSVLNVNTCIYKMPSDILALEIAYWC